MKGFTRRLAASAQAEVRRLHPGTDLRKGWTHRALRSSWEFHGPGGFYWHGRAEDGWHARFLGWTAWLAAQAAP